ncbi:MAG TPA: hypothetical protein VFH72_01600 [Candidatus Baltobacteraceae bacterium]|nr:hypothetical protein [Candidatus Baltobacteraceae bacterium]
MIEAARAVADAVLYEGFLLFPYGKNALKNQMPFQFGVVMPQGYADPTEPHTMHAQFVLCGGTGIAGVLRFLQILEQPVEREVAFCFALADESAVIPFALDGLSAEIALVAEREGAISRIALDVRNLTPAVPGASRNESLQRAFVSAHVLLEAQGGRFASLLDPPEQAKDAVARCTNERTFPVLVGEPQQGEQSASTLLVSPIILYDFPRIAPASRARTFDGTEIDELLMLSVASLSEEEKRDARAAHPYVRELVERAEALDADTQRTLHGELTGGAPRAGEERVVIAGATIAPGSRVRIQPKGRADVWDGLVRGMTARVNAVHTDFEGKRYVGVVFDADPASDMHEWYGRSFFYGVDEVEPLP